MDILTLNCVTLTLIQDHVISTIYFSHSNSVTLKKKELDIYPSIQLWAEMLELDKDTHRPDRNLYHVSIVAHFIGATVQREEVTSNNNLYGTIHTT